MSRNSADDAGTSSRKVDATICRPAFPWNRRRRFFLLGCVVISCFLAADIVRRLNTTTGFRFEDGKEQDEKISENAKKRDKLYLEYFQAQETFDQIIGIKRRKRLPKVIGIGVEKCGTGALGWMLRQHPMIISANPMETHFFGTSKAKNGLNSYIKLMPAVAEHENAMEKTPAYFNFNSPDTPNEIRRSVPDAKTIVILCDPVNRTFSDFVQEIKMNHLKEDANFEETVSPLIKIISSGLRSVAHDADATNKYIFNAFRKNPQTHVLTTGLYYYHFTRWFKVYNETNLHIVDGEELMSNPGSAMEKIQEFLDIPKLVIPEDFVLGPKGFYCISMPRINRSENGITLQKPIDPICLGAGKSRTRMGQWKHQPSEAVVNALRQFFAPHNEKLFTLLGRKFNWQRPA